MAKKKDAALNKTRKPPMNRVARGVIAGLKEAIAHARSEISLPVHYYNVPGRVDVQAIRAKSGLSQSEFARRFGFSVRTLQDWELGRTSPPSAVRAYFTVIDRFPETVQKALKRA
jgi:putative transcriptional regulator